VSSTQSTSVAAAVFVFVFVVVIVVVVVVVVRMESHQTTHNPMAEEVSAHTPGSAGFQESAKSATLVENLPNNFDHADEEAIQYFRGLRLYLILAASVFPTYI
jgi:hypothetical protein